MSRRMAATARTIPQLFYVVVIFAFFHFSFSLLQSGRIVTAERPIELRRLVIALAGDEKGIVRLLDKSVFISGRGNMNVI